MLIRYYHAAAGFPTQPTWSAAIKNQHCATWKGLMVAGVRRHFLESNETWKGHVRKVLSGLRSTKKLPEIEQDGQLTTKKVGPKTGTLFTKTYNLYDNLERKMYKDRTGKLPVKLYRGMKYIMVLFGINSNGILVESMRNRTSGEMVKAYQTLVDRLKERGFKPKLRILDNECLTEFKEAIARNGMDHQLVSPNDHHRNNAKKSLQTFKHHFVAILCGIDVTFPVQRWCRILRQAEHQLNLLRKSRVNLKVSNFGILYGQHNYDANPFPPPGSAVQMHVIPGNRKTWEAHTKAGFYLGNS